MSEVDISSEDIVSARIGDPRNESEFDNLDVRSYVAQTERMSPQLLMAKEKLQREKTEKQEAWKTERKDLDNFLQEFEEELSHSPLKKNWFKSSLIIKLRLFRIEGKQRKIELIQKYLL